mgnify:FL=1
MDMYRKAIIYVLSNNTIEEFEDTFNDVDFVDTLGDGYREVFKEDVLQMILK